MDAVEMRYTLALTRRCAGCSQLRDAFFSTQRASTQFIPDAMGDAALTRSWTQLLDPVILPSTKQWTSVPAQA